MLISSVQFGSVAQSCLTLCHPMNCSTPGSPVLHYLLEYAQIMSIESVMLQPAHPLMPSPPSSLDISQRQWLLQWVVCVQPKYWSFSVSISPSSEYPGSFSLKMDWMDLLAVQGTFRSLLQFEGINSLVLCLLYGSTLTTICDHWEDYSLDYMDLCWQGNVSAFQHTV